MPNFQPFIDAMDTFKTGLQAFNQDSSSIGVLEEANVAAKTAAEAAQKAVDDKNAAIAADAALLAPLVANIGTIATALAAELATPPAA